MNNKMYFEDIFIFAKFIILNKFIFIFSILFFSIFSISNYYINYNKYLDGIYNENLIEISNSSVINNLSNKDLVDIYLLYPYKRLTYDEYDINNFLFTFDDILTRYFDENKLSYETLNKNSKKIIYKFNGNEYFSKLISEKILLNYYQIAKNEFTLNIQEETDNVYELFLDTAYSYLSNLKNSIIKMDWEMARDIDNRFGLKHMYNELCHLDNAKWIDLNKKPNIDCNINKELKFDYKLNDMCEISNTNVRIEDVLSQYLMTDIECVGGVFPNRKVFDIANKYIYEIKNSNFIDIKFTTEQKYKFAKPKLISYLLATILFGFFFSIILVFLFRIKKYF